MKDLRDLKDSTIYDVQPISGEYFEFCLRYRMLLSTKECSVLVYVVYLVIYDSGYVTLRHLLFVCLSPQK